VGDGMAFKNTHLFPGQRWLSIAVSALFQLATISGALLIVHDAKGGSGAIASYMTG